MLKDKESVDLLTPFDNHLRLLQVWLYRPLENILLTESGTHRTLRKNEVFSIIDFFSKCDQIRRKLRIWSHQLKKFVMENFIFCTVEVQTGQIFDRFFQWRQVSGYFVSKFLLCFYWPIQCRSSHRRCSVKKVFLEMSQNSQENICARDSFLIKLQA